MTIITIGRGQENKYVIDEPEISRLHAIVKVNNTGKLWIIDKSSNGTFVNGIKIASNVAVPVTRKDDVSFAKVRHLDWTEIPDPAKKIKLGILAAVAAIALIVVAVVVIPMLGSSSELPQETPMNGGGTVVNNDSIRKAKDEQKKDTAAEKKSNPNWANQIVAREEAQKRAAEAARNKPKPAPKPAPVQKTTPKPDKKSAPKPAPEKVIF